MFTTPIVYLYFDKAQQRLARRGWGVRSQDHVPGPDVGPEATP
jgi:multidrug efflux pump